MSTPWSSAVLRRVVCVLTLCVLMMAGLFAGRAWADQPHMRAALEHLRRARVELERADADKGGHRVAALARVADAIGEVEAGIAYGGGR